MDRPNPLDYKDLSCVFVFTREEIIEERMRIRGMKPRAWLIVSNITGLSRGVTETQDIELQSERLVPLYGLEAIEEEREECAKLCESITVYDEDDPMQSCADAIRKRGAI